MSRKTLSFIHFWRRERRLNISCDQKLKFQIKFKRKLVTFGKYFIGAPYYFVWFYQVNKVKQNKSKNKLMIL